MLREKGGLRETLVCIKKTAMRVDEREKFV
jgi:hypothetical protein